MKRHTLNLISLLLLIACNSQHSNEKLIGKDSSASSTSSMEKLASTGSYTGPRFEIIQSTLAAKGTFRLDTYSGEVCQMQADGNKSTVWHKLRRLPALIEGLDSTIDGRPNYHLFLSTIAMRFTYLINVNTGTTWELVEDQQTKEDLFSPIFQR